MPRTSERPTTPPEFDVALYAKESDVRVRTVRSSMRDEDSTPPETPQSETRLATRPSMGATMTDESWARSMIGTLVVAIPLDQLRRMPLDHRTGFLLSLMDGTLDLATIIDVSAMAQADALRAVRDLYDAGIIAFR